MENNIQKLVDVAKAVLRGRSCPHQGELGERGAQGVGKEQTQPELGGTKDTVRLAERGAGGSSGRASAFSLGSWSRAPCFSLCPSPSAPAQALSVPLSKINKKNLF